MSFSHSLFSAARSNSDIFGNCPELSKFCLFCMPDPSPAP
jgi:hypothetical protein